MKKSIYVSLTLISLSIFSCSQQNSYEKVLKNAGQEWSEYHVRFTDASFDENYQLEAESFGLSNLIGSNTDIILFDSLLVVANRGDSSMVSAIDLKNKKLHANYGVWGNGPGEIYTSSYSLSRKSNDHHTVWSFDPTLGRMTSFDLSKKQRQSSNQINVFEDGTTKIKLIWKDSLSFVGLDFNGEGRFGEYDSKGRPVKYFGEYQSDGYENYPKAVLAQLNQGFLKSNSENSVFLKTCLNLDRVEILNYEKSALYQFNGPDQITPTFGQVEDPQGNAVLTLDRMKNYYTYTDAYVAKDRVYLLYSGKQWNGSPIGKLNCDVMYVFDMEGRPLHKLEFSEEILNFTINEKERRIYAISANEGNGIITFDLGSISTI